VAASPSIARTGRDSCPPSDRFDPAEHAKPVEFSGVFRGRELTRKDRRLPSGLPILDALLDGGIVRGRISEIVGGTSAGKTSLAASFAAYATRRGEVAAWIDLAGAFDPASISAAGVELSHLLWVHAPGRKGSSPLLGEIREGFARRSPAKNLLRAAELILEAGGFGIVVIDFGSRRIAIRESAALRLARMAERSGTAVLVLASHRMCGTFAAMSLALDARPAFSRIRAHSPALFDGFAIDARIARNKLGGIGAQTNLRALADPLPLLLPAENFATPRARSAIGPSPAPLQERAARRDCCGSLRNNRDAVRVLSNAVPL
jgi:hypothetical protein